MLIYHMTYAVCYILYTAYLYYILILHTVYCLLLYTTYHKLYTLYSTVYSRYCILCTLSILQVCYYYSDEKRIVPQVYFWRIQYSASKKMINYVHFPEGNIQVPNATPLYTIYHIQHTEYDCATYDTYIGRCHRQHAGMPSPTTLRYR